MDIKEKIINEIMNWSDRDIEEALKFDTIEIYLDNDGEIHISRIAS